MKYLFTLILILTVASISKATTSQENILLVLDNNLEEKTIGKHILIYQDSDNLSFDEIIEKDSFNTNQALIPNLGLTTDAVWLKINVQNKSSITSFLLDIEYPMLDEVEFFYPDSNNEYVSIYLTETFLEKRDFNTPAYVFNLSLLKNETKTYYLKIKNTEQILLPISIKTNQSFWSSVSTKNIINGIYIGIILIMFFYNLFVFFSVRDKSYLYYVLYVISTGLTHMGIQGYSLSYFFPTINIDGSILTIYASIAGISVVLFTKSFLETKFNAKKLNYGLSLLTILFSASLTLIILGKNHIGFSLMQMATTLFSFYILIVSYYFLFKGYKQASFIALSMSILLIGAIIFLLKDFGILPYNNVTNYSMQTASALEMVLLSFALANRINIFRSEKETAQEEVVLALKENEKIIREQNVILEEKVEERTLELNKTLGDLKQTQSKLVDAEKMSSLGQLTAGIAHEINNPINFVSSNITPLRQDIDDLNSIMNKYEEITDAENVKEKLNEINQLKEELDYDYLKTELTSIVDGIEDGAKRTTEIVSGLRNFSRLDEGELKEANINEGVESTLILIKNKLNGIKVKKELGEIPTTECYPGKLNQLLMNLIDNSIDAIHSKETDNKEGIINISTTANNEYLFITIKDNGIGFNNEIKEKLFEPFFTTKKVGKGTGLGLSIVYSIIEAHNGGIEVTSNEKAGTEITVKIPIIKHG